MKTYLLSYITVSVNVVLGLGLALPPADDLCWSSGGGKSDSQIQRKIFKTMKKN